MGSTAVMNVMLGWLKSVARWVLGLFDLAGASAFSPLKWLSEHWLTMLLVLLIAGIVIDLIVWLLRWRPYWVWFNKKRIVVDDDDFFAGEDLVDSGLYDPDLFEVAPGRAPARGRRSAPAEDERPVRRTRTSARTPRRDPRVQRRPIHDDPLFQINPDAEEEPAVNEDEVFNVSDLPVSQDELTFRNNRRTGR